MKLKKVSFDNHGFRKLKNFSIDFAKYITIISGHNGIGKSSILGLIANASGLTLKKEGISLFEKTFQADFSDLFFLDYHKDHADFYEQKEEKTPPDLLGEQIVKLNKKEISPPPATLITYEINDEELHKHCKVSAGHTTLVDKDKLKGKPFLVEVPHSQLNAADKKAITHDSSLTAFFRLRIIARTSNNKEISPETLSLVKQDGKVPIPTIYLGMSRMAPIGEFFHSDISTKKQTNEYTQYVSDLYSRIFTPIGETNHESGEQESLNEAYLHSFSNSNKKALVPNSKHGTLSISLGQDSVASILTALASFYKLKQERCEEYNGGLLVIDELDAGLHPYAQFSLLNLLYNEAKKLSLQIVATSHSLTVIKTILDLNEQVNSSEVTNANNLQNTVFYLRDSNRPRPLPQATYTAIKNDMLMRTYRREEPQEQSSISIKLYFEDQEALDCFKGILESKNINDSRTHFGRDLNLIPVFLGCDTLLKLAKADADFNKAIFILDADVNDIKKNFEGDFPDNVLLLPSNSNLPPDQLIFGYLQEKLQDLDNSFWDQNIDLTTDYVNEIMIKPLDDKLSNLTIESQRVRMTDTKNKVKKREIYKDEYNQHRDRIIDSKLFTQWANELINNEDCTKFLTTLANKIDLLSRQNRY